MATRLFGISFLILFLELSLIRWTGSHVRIIAYFPNLVLIAAFFGIGMGSLYSGKRNLFSIWVFLFLANHLLIWICSRIVFIDDSGNEYFWLLYMDLPESAPVIKNIAIPILLFFSTTTLLFIPLGQQLAHALVAYQKEKKTLTGYLWDLFGSLCGVILFTLFSGFSLPPVAWFIAIALVGVFILEKSWQWRSAFLLASGGVLFVTLQLDSGSIYSPYYRLQYETLEKENQTRVLTNGSLHQIMLPLHTPQEEMSEYTVAVSKGFHQPFQYFDTPPKDVLILGAGTGNDIAICLLEGAESIDAVEIDPQIQKLGKAMHPSQPYQSDKVTAHITDARTYLSNCQKKYDLILFGTLDSMTKTSAMSGVRLDNFVYTQECFETASKLLKPDGGIICHFRVTETHIAHKIWAILKETFDENAIAFIGERYLFNVTFMAGSAFEGKGMGRREGFVGDNYEALSNISNLPNDDWPFLYLQERKINPIYLEITVGILVIALLTFLLIQGRQSLDMVKPQKFEPEMFFMGIAFLLLNTKSVVNMGLVWGNTWLTNAIAFGAILSLMLVATAFIRVKPLNIHVSFVGLFVCLFLNYFTPLSALLVSQTWLKLILSILYVGLPFFFASTCFAILFKSRPRVNLAFGWNIIGALFGGLLEYTSTLFGFSALIVFAFGFYGLVYLAHLRRSRLTVPHTASAAAVSS